VAVLIATTSPICSGIISFDMIQHYASERLKSRGIKIGVLNSRNRVLQELTSFDHIRRSQIDQVVNGP